MEREEEERARDIGWRGTELDRGFRDEDQTQPVPDDDPDATWPLEKREE